MQFEDKLDFLPAGKYSAAAIENLGGESIQALMLGLRMQMIVSLSMGLLY